MRFLGGIVVDIDERLQRMRSIMMEGLLKQMIMIVMVAVTVVAVDEILILSGDLFAWRLGTLCRLSRGGSDRVDALSDVAVEHGDFIVPPS